VVSGLGVVAPNGIGLDVWWRATLNGESGIKRITHFDPAGYPTRYAGEVEGFRPEDHMDAHLVAQTDRSTQMALAATRMALADAGLDLSRDDPARLGISLACSSGGAEVGQR
jgi:act minimal PKS chain-length factor (CLF/KS beta)